MTRNFKVLGIALVAAFAFSAVTASGASAKAGMLTASGEGPWTLDISETAEPGGNIFTAYGNTTDCTENAYHAELEESGLETVTVTPTYKNCITTQGGAPLSSTAQMGACAFLFRAPVTTDIPIYTWEATVNLECASGTPTIAVFSSSSHALRVCTIGVTPGQDLTTHNLHFTNTTPEVGKRDVGLKGTVTVETHKTGLCGAGTETATYHVDVTIEATDKNEVKQDLTISTEP